MAILDPSIMGGDEQWNIEELILKICGIDYDEYLSQILEGGKKVLNNVIFEKNFDKIFNLIENYKSDSCIAYPYHVLGYFVLITGSKLPEEIKKRILASINWDNEEGLWPPEMVEERKSNLHDFRSKIINHRQGIISNFC